uniref:C2H2-type domain-containing protein n=1 Tax=Syphacia muris TaxID=451379 RepID=A0A0N5AF07_9BILA
MSRVEDTALLQTPVQMGKDGLESIIQIWNDATVEVKNILNNECNILLQCRARIWDDNCFSVIVDYFEFIITEKCCRNVFRSLVNFISHKRGFCRTLYGSPNEAVTTKGQDNSKHSGDKPDVEVIGAHKGVKKTKGLLKRLNIVGVLNKRIEHLESKYDLSTLPKIERSIPETTFRNGVQVLKIRPKPADQNATVLKQRTALVIPQDHCVQYLDMNLRRRENNQKENCVREVGDDEVDVMDRLERFRPGLADFGALKCLCKKCGDIGSFSSVFVLAYHISIKHNSRYLTDGLYCFLCGSHFLNYNMLVDHLQKSHGEHRRLHYETRSLQALEKEQKRNRKLKNSDVKIHCSSSERLRSLSPCTEKEIDEMMASVSEQRATDQQRLKFLHSKSDRNLEKSDDDEVTLQVDESEQVSGCDNDKAVFDCVCCLIDQICSNENCNPNSERLETADTSTSVKTSCASVSGDCSKSILATGPEFSSEKVDNTNSEEQICNLDAEVHSSSSTICGNDKLKIKDEDDVLVDQVVTAHDNNDTKDEVAAAPEADSKQVGKERVEGSDGNSDLKKRRKILCEKGRRRNRKRGRRIVKAPVVKDEAEKQPINKKSCTNVKSEVAESEKTNVYNTRRCVLRSGTIISSVVHKPAMVLPTTPTTSAAVTEGTASTSSSLDKNLATTKNESSYSCKRRVVKRKVLQKEDSKIGQEASKKKSQCRNQYERELRKCSSLKRIASTDNSRSKRLRLDELRSSSTSSAATAGKSEQSYSSLGETKRKSDNAVSRQVPHVKDPGPSNVNTTPDVMKKTGAFLRRNYLSQRKEDSAIVTTQNSAGNAASFMDPSSIPVYMTEAENKAIFSFVVPDKTSPGKLYRCRYCNDTFESEMVRKDSRKHAVGHLRIIRLRCSLCGCCSFFCSDMRIHLQMRHCEKLNRAPAHIVAPGRKIPCMTYNQADSLIEVAVKEKPGRVAFTLGKIISNVSYKPYYPDAVTERKILENTSLKDVTETVP